ncbi:anthranilate phosphoribosyltransferase [Serratia marcescens]|nr:anthranilate phosphoribosyltransferase [Serratia marcescens]MBH2865776.1 anthranilate phosphoribosyltransferase [Serratia marcescens]MBW4239710.1 anthranilate phosphoribosyltransferase [Enterobacter roggenkampii]
MALKQSTPVDAEIFGAAMRRLVEERGSLGREQTCALVIAMLEQRLDKVQIAALLCAIAQKQETPDELAGAVDAIAARNPPISLVPHKALNIGGTGGDRAGTFNISTTASLVVAASGVPVVKHGNKRMTSDSGSSDLVAALGVDVDRSSQKTQIRQTLDASGFAFVSTAAYYDIPASLCDVRRRIGIRCLFNLTGPLVHPAKVEFQLIGVARPELLPLMANTLAQLGGGPAYVVHGAGGLDEVSCLGETQILGVRDGAIEAFTVGPEDFGVRTWTLSEVRGGSPLYNARICEAVLAGERGAHRDATIVVAGAALVLAGKASSFREAADMSSYALDSGRAVQTLTRFKEAMHEAGQDLRDN